MYASKNFVPAVAPRRPVNRAALAIVIVVVLAAILLIGARSIAATEGVSLFEAFVLLHARLSAWGWNFLCGLFAWEASVVRALWDAVTGAVR